MNFADYIAMVLGLLLIVAVALQSSQDDVAAAFSVAKAELFKTSKPMGLELFLVRFTAVVSFLFVAIKKKKKNNQ